MAGREYGKRRSPLAALVKLNLESSFGMASGWSDFLHGGAKAKLKALGIFVLAAYCAMSFSVMFVVVFRNLYAVFAPLGMADIVLLQGFFTATAMTLMVGVITSISFYFMSGPERALAAMPFRPTELFFPKFAMAYLSEAAVSVLVMGCACAVYGLGEGSGPAFYLAALGVAVLVPAVPLAFCYALTVPLMQALKLFRNRDRMMVVAGAFGLLLVLPFNIGYQAVMARLGDTEWVIGVFGEGNALLGRIASGYPPSFLALGVLRDPVSAGGWLSFLAFASLCAAVVAVTVRVVSGTYAKGIMSDDETLSKRLSDSGTFISKSFGRKGAAESLFLREFRLLFREPQYVLNGPLVILLLPFIILAAVWAQGENVQAAFAELSAMDEGGTFLRMAAFCSGSFLCITTSVPASAMSREGKGFFVLKALPVRPSEILAAKFMLSLAVGIPATLVGTGSVAFLGEMGGADTIPAFLGAIAFCVFYTAASLLLDCRFAKLHWTNKLGAMKQNPNVVISMVTAMGIIALAAFAASSLFSGVSDLWALAAAFSVLSCAVIGIGIARAPGIVARLE